MTSISIARRFGLCALALSCSALLLRTEVSCAIVTRGDDELYRGSVDHARALYRRAVRVDPRNESATDRLAFTSIFGHRRARMRDGVNTATKYLLQVGESVAIRIDRALLEEALGEFTAGADDFVRLASLERTAESFTIAGVAVLHANEPDHARALWKRARRIDPTYRPAIIALQRHTQ